MRIAPLIAFLLLFSTVTARAQPYVEAAGGVTGSFGSVPVFAGSPDCGRFATALPIVDGANDRWSLAAGWVFDSLPADMGFRLGLALNHSATTFSTTPVDRFVAVVDGTLTAIDRRYELSVSDWSIRLRPSVRIQPFGLMNLDVGAEAGYRFGLTAYQDERMLGGYGFATAGTFRNGDTSVRLMLDDERGSFDAERMSAGLSIGIPVRMGDEFELEPSVLLDLVSPLTGRTWTTLGASVALRWYPFDASADSLTKPVPQEPVRTTAPPPRAAIALSGRDERGNPTDAARVNLFGTFTRTRMNLTRWIVFDTNTAALPGSFPRLSPAAAAAFEPDSLVEMPAGALVRQSLNVIASRMRRDTAATIWLAGRVAPGEPAWLAYARVESVRHYFESVWEIEPERLEVRNLEGRLPQDVPADVPAVFIGGDAGVLRPLHARRLDDDVDPPLVSIAPRIEAASGVRDWEITLRAGGTVLGRYTRAQSRSGEDVTLHWTAGGVDSLGRSRLAAELAVVDSLGRRDTASASVALDLHYRLRAVDRQVDPVHGIETATITFFPVSDDDTGARNRNAQAAAALIAAMGPGATVEAAGRLPDGVLASIADRIGRAPVADGGTDPAAELQSIDSELPIGRRLSADGWIRISRHFDPTGR